MDEGNPNRGRFVPSSAVQLASLFHADEDYSSDSDQERAFSPLHRARDGLPGSGSHAQGVDSSSPAYQAANILSAAAALRGSFPSPPPPRGRGGGKQDDEELAQPARTAPGARKKHAVAGGVLAGPPPNSANGSPIDSPGTASARKGGSSISNRIIGNSKTSNSSSSRSSSKVNAQSGGKDRDIEAARRTQEASRATSVAASEFEVRQKEGDTAVSTRTQYYCSTVVQYYSSTYGIIYTSIRTYQGTS